MAFTMLGDLSPDVNIVRTGYIDELKNFTNLFNGGSNGTITLVDTDVPGTLAKTKFFKDFGTVSRRDITSNNAQTPEKIERAEHAKFKTFFKLNALEWLDDAFYTADRMEQESILYMIGSQLAKKKMQNALKQAIGITAAAIESQAAATVLDLTAGTKRNFLQPDITSAKAKWGDRYGDFRAMVMHSSAFFVLDKNQTLNFQYDLGGGVTLYGGAPATGGLPLIVVDDPSLVYTDTDTCYKTLLLTKDAVTIGNDGNLRAMLTPNGGKENIGHTFQAEWACWNTVKGYELKSSAHPEQNPEESVLTTASNWQKWTADIHNTAGVLVKSIADLNKVQQVIYVQNIEPAP